jgi:MFS family permease
VAGEATTSGPATGRPRSGGVGLRSERGPILGAVMLATGLTSIIVAGTALLLLFGEHTSVWQVAATCLIIGAGMGLTVSPTLISAQSSVGWRERGVVTANNLFLRSVGSSLGIAGFGALANAVVSRSGGQVDPAALTSAVRHIFLAVVVIAVLMLVTALALPRQPLPEPG